MEKVGKKWKKGKTGTKLSTNSLRHGRVQKIFPEANKNLVGLFKSNTNKSYMNYFIKWQKLANQFPEVNDMPAEGIYVILYMLSFEIINRI